VFIEFLANDGTEMDNSLNSTEKAQSYERLLRKVMAMPSAPAVVLVQVRRGKCQPQAASSSQCSLTGIRQDDSVTCKLMCHAAARVILAIGTLPCQELAAVHPTRPVSSSTSCGSEP
jgi:hypothetical protein